VANHPSAEKRTRQRGKRRDRNRVVLGSMRTALKNARAAIASEEGDVAALVKSATRMIDKAVQKGAVKKRAGSRTISRLVRQARAK